LYEQAGDLTGREVISSFRPRPCRSKSPCRFNVLDIIVEEKAVLVCAALDRVGGQSASTGFRTETSALACW
jgi:hypothetical protein